MDDDPWDWSVDRVVKELCTADRSWQGARGSMPDPVELERALREQGIEGNVFLLELNNVVLREEFGLKISARTYVKSAYQELRLKSPQYQQWCLKHHTDSYYSRSMEGMAHPSPGTYLPPRHAGSTMPSPATLAAKDSITTQEHDFPGNKRLKSLEADQIDDFSPEFHDFPEDLDILNRANAISTEHPQSAGVGINGKKRKRIAPTLISSILDSSVSREVPSSADHVILNHPSYIKPGTVFTDENGKKKLRPIHLSQDSKAIIGTGTLGLRQGQREHFQGNGILESLSSSLAKGYLGKNKMPVDDIFYTGVGVGEDLPTDSDDIDEFSLVSRGNISSGRRLYIHGITKYLFRSNIRVFQRHGKTFQAVLPYPTKLAPRHQEPSCTLYFISSDKKVHSRREHISVWPEIDPDATQKPSEDPFLDGGDTAIDWDPSCLEKYRLLEGGDSILPLYGESDEENEYDVDTWAEMEKERGEKLEKLPMVLKNSKLNPEAVNDAIDEAIAELVKAWRTTKLPKLLLAAWKIWAKARRDGNRRFRVQQLQLHLEHLKTRVAKMRAEIIGELWSSRKQVLKQTRIMEETIFQRESHAWEITLLERKSAPDKPTAEQQARLAATAAAKKAKKQHNVDEDGESLESEDDFASSDEDNLDDFIVSDGVGSATDKDLGLDLIGDEDDSDSATSERSVDPTSKIARAFTRRRTFSSIGQEEAAMDLEFNEGSVISAKDIRSPPHNSSRSARDMDDELSLPQHRRGGRAITSPQDIIELSSDGPDSQKYPGQIDLCTPTKPRPSQLPSSSSRPGKINIKLFTDSKPSNLPDKKDLPPLKDPKAISKYSSKIWTSMGDRDRLIIRFLYTDFDFRTRLALLNTIKGCSEDKLWIGIIGAAKTLATNKDYIEGVPEGSRADFRHLVRMLLMYIHCKELQILRFSGDSLAAKHLSAVEQSYEEEFPDFFQLCRKLPRYFQGVKDDSRYIKETEDQVEDQDDDDEDDEEPQQANKRRPRPAAVSDEEVPEEQPRKKRKKIAEDATAREMRNQDRVRLAEQEQRRLKLQAKLHKFGNTGVANGRIIINETKYEHHGYVYVHEVISQRIKPHQIDGVRFMWNQIVMHDEKLQGCLLAHTMGLGKTMQTITLLVAIAEASSSPDPRVSSQIPDSLKVSKTLILCPPGLIDNWVDELLIWAPKELLGDIRKIDAALKDPRERLQVIENWYEDAGVLIMGYEMFRKIIHNPPDKSGRTLLSEEEHARIKEALTDGPNIIVADEAHKMKNARSKITLATQNFRSMSRIALTGSPLANNVEEYHTMIDWIAPNYLGPISEFRLKYATPIQEGLYYDSEPYERRRSLKVLRVLTNDLSPKVHRADMTVLRNELPPKTEFVVAVPLTPLQHAAYTIYVKAMLSTTNDVTQSTLWHWLAVLTLLCNHPSCFKAKLEERSDEAQSKSQQLASSNPIEDPEDANIWKAGVSKALVREELQLFDHEADITSMLLSNKVKILCQILDASKQAGDKVLLFSSSIPTLDYLEQLCTDQDRKFNRLDGTTNISKRQKHTKDFNSNDTEVYLISTRAGGLGLNLYGANRVVIFDFKFNPIEEEQAVGRAFRIGQVKPVFVYRLIAAGTFEEVVHNTAVFKKQLASRVVDKKSPVSWAKKKTGEYLFEPRDTVQHDLAEYKGKDQLVLDKVLERQTPNPLIRSIVQSDTFEKTADENLTAEEEREVSELIKAKQLERLRPKEYHAINGQRESARRAELYKQGLAQRLANRAPLQQTQASSGESSMMHQVNMAIAAVQQDSAARRLNGLNRGVPSIGQPQARAAIPISEGFDLDQSQTPPSVGRQNRHNSPILGANTRIADSAQNTTTLPGPKRNMTTSATHVQSYDKAHTGKSKDQTLPERPVTQVKSRSNLSSVAVVTPVQNAPQSGSSPQGSPPKPVSSLEVLSIFQKEENALRRKRTDQLRSDSSTVISVLERIIQPLPAHEQEAAMKAVCKALRASPSTVTALLLKTQSPKGVFREIINNAQNGNSTVQNSKMFKAMSKRPAVPDSPSQSRHSRKTPKPSGRGEQQSGPSLPSWAKKGLKAKAAESKSSEAAPTKATRD